MAIKKDVTEKRFSMTIPDAYVKLAYIDWSDRDKILWAHFSTWANSTAEAEGKECISLFRVDVTTACPNLQADIYAVAKTKPELAGGVDV